MNKLHPLPHIVARTVMMAIVCLLPELAVCEPLTDLHDIVVGMPAQQLPAEGYKDFRCAGRSIANWSDWASCPVDETDGLRAVHVAYDQPGEETKVAGHPVKLTVFFDGAGRLAKIEIKTVDRVPLFLHKKAYLLARQAKAHYGEDRWICKDVPASQYEEAIGAIYINDACTKVLAERRIKVSRRLFRWKGSAPRDFVSDTTISVGMPSAELK